MYTRLSNFAQFLALQVWSVWFWIKSLIVSHIIDFPCIFQVFRFGHGAPDLWWGSQCVSFHIWVSDHYLLHVPTTYLFLYRLAVM